LTSETLGSARTADARRIALVPLPVVRVVRLHRGASGGADNHLRSSQLIGVRLRLMILYDYPASSNCMRVRVLLRHLEIPYERVALDLFRGETREAAHFARDPDGRVPTLELDDGRRGDLDTVRWWQVRSARSRARRS
jgi:Glutathione S-transferase, N-terminal domain